MSVDEQYAMLEKLKPGKFSEPIEYNLMFKTNFGEKNHIFLRPETAQGMFMNFRRMRDFNGHKLPFAVGQIGKSFRNELQTSSQAMQRLREFNMAELQVFFDPENVIEIKSNHEAPKCLVWSAIDQISGNTASVRELTEVDVNGNKIYLYYLQKVIKFAETIGLDLTKCRLRQHSDYEMAHYSTDCWDLEVELFDNSWSECVGIANRGCYDLTNHGEKSGAVHNYSAERTNEHGKVERYVPHVIEPSFGLDRLVMAVLVHNYKERLAVTVKSVRIGNVENSN
jgi:glycyl-tRNA synthetase